MKLVVSLTTNTAIEAGPILDSVGLFAVFFHEETSFVQKICVVAGAPYLFTCYVLSKHFFKLSFKFFRFLYKTSTEID